MPQAELKTGASGPSCEAENALARPRVPAAQEPPLCVDLDGTLIRSDVLWEQLILGWRHLWVLVCAAWALRLGKAAFKAALAQGIPLDPVLLPYREELLNHLQQQRAQGRRLVLVTATHQRVAEHIAGHLGLFDDVMASSAKLNLGGQTKRDALVARFGDRGFDYIGDHSRDVAVFASARRALLAEPSAALLRATARVAPVERVFNQGRRLWEILPRALRVHQWTKNALLAVPLVAAHRLLDAPAWGHLLLAFVCWSLLASATYMVNDLHDLPFDRLHRKKRYRPLAHGDLSIPAGLGLVVLLGGSSLAMAVAFLPHRFTGLLLAYVALTLAYSFQLKRYMVVDALTLAMLYTLRLLAGAAAISVGVSEWLLMFSLFLFVSLALLKRYVELRDAPVGELPGRGYQLGDIDVILSIGPTTGLMSVLVLALYINSPAVPALYPSPDLLWLLCPVLIYWVARVWLLARRGEVHHDPIAFTLMDPGSYGVALVSTLVLLAASVPMPAWLG